MLGLLALGWLTWIGGTIGVVPNSAAVLGGAGAAGRRICIAGLSQRVELADFFRRRWTVVATTELLFLAVFAFWALVISEVPAINHTEKPWTSAS